MGEVVTVKEEPGHVGKATGATKETTGTTKKRYRKWLWIALIAFLAVAAAIIVAALLLSHKNDCSTISTSTPMSVDKLVSSTASQHRRLGGQSDLLALQSKTAFSYAIVDGLRAKLQSISFIGRNSGSELHFISGGNYRDNPIEFTIDAANASSTLDSIPLSIADDTYNGFCVGLSGHMQVKAYCKTVNYLLYTNAQGVQRISPNAAALPDDYDYMDLQLVQYGTTTGSDIQPVNFFPITIDSPQAAKVLFDLSYLFTCYDGTLPALPVNPPLAEAISPFSDYSNGQTVSRYAPNTPVISLQYAALFFWSGNTSSAEDLPTGETYLYTLNADDLLQLNTSSLVDVKLFGAWTIAYDKNGNVLAIQTRGVNLFDATGFHNITYLGNDTYSMANGPYGKDSQVFRSDRFFSNFTRIRGDDYTTIVPVLLGDGPDCVPYGHSLAPGDFGYPCSGNKLVYFRKIKRNI